MAKTINRQNWQIGALVNVGFMKNLKVIQITYRFSGRWEHVYTVESANGTRYEFTPHNGIRRIN